MIQTLGCRLSALAAETAYEPRINVMSTGRYVHWQDGGVWIGYFQNFPDYMTQGDTVEELQANLGELYADLTSGEIPGIRRVADLTIR